MSVNKVKFPHKEFINISSNQISDVTDYLLPYIKQGTVIVLEGDLGAGKTTFARALIKSLTGVDNVISPTFNLVQVYEGKGLKIWHYDLYRIKHFLELEELAIEEALNDIIIMEWHQLAKAYLPYDTICITIDFTESDTVRNFNIKSIV